MDVKLFDLLRAEALTSIASYDSIQLSRRKYDQALDPVCRKWALTRGELDVLLFLHNNPDYDRASDIVARRGMTKSHVSLSVSTLESKGLLRRCFEPADRRVAHLKLEDAALPILEEGLAAQEWYFAQLFDGLTREELQLWISIMNKVSQNIVKMDAQ